VYRRSNANVCLRCNQFLLPKATTERPHSMSGQFSIPAAIAASAGLTDDACTRTSSSLAPAAGVGSSLRRPGGLSKLSRVNAHISAERPTALRPHRLLIKPAGAPDRRRRAHKDRSFQRHAESGRSPEESQAARSTPGWQRSQTDRPPSLSSHPTRGRDASTTLALLGFGSCRREARASSTATRSASMRPFRT
jgi:hypothetical protein